MIEEVIQTRLQRMGKAGRARYERAHRIEDFLVATWRQYGEVADAWPVSS